MDWPAKAPDLNTIEQSLKILNPAKNLGRLLEVLIEEWKANKICE